MSNAAIDTTALGKVYPGGVRALEDVSIRTGYGEVFAYLGRNGSGKTTTIRILTTLSAATTGTARVAGHDVHQNPEAVRRVIGVTMQKAALDETMTGRDLQTGFLDRLRLLPVRPAALMLGRLLFDVVRVTAAGLGVLAVAVALGAPLRGGPLGIVAIAVLLAGWTLGYPGLYYVVGLKARSPEALTALVPLFLPISLLSTAYVPADLLPGWVRTAAAVNPYSHVVDTVRAAMAGTLDADRLVAGLAAVIAAVVLTQVAAARRFAGLVHRN